MRGLSRVMPAGALSSCGAQAAHCRGLSLRARALGSVSFRTCSAVFRFGAHGMWIFLDQSLDFGIELCPLRWEGGFFKLNHQGCPPLAIWWDRSASQGSDWLLAGGGHRMSGACHSQNCPIEWIGPWPARLSNIQLGRDSWWKPCFLILLQDKKLFLHGFRAH